MNPQRCAHYRRFRRLGLEAVQYSTPARYSIIRSLQGIFRDSKNADTTPEVIEKTARFLKRARHVGMEKKLLRNLAFTSWSFEESRTKRPKEAAAQEQGLRVYREAVQKMNDSCGILLGCT